MNFQRPHIQNDSKEFVQSKISLKKIPIKVTIVHVEIYISYKKKKLAQSMQKNNEFEKILL